MRKRLSQRIKTNLDDPIGKYWPGVPNGDRITLAQLAEMRSGLYNYTFDDDFSAAIDKDPQQVWTPAELLAIAPGYALDNLAYFLIVVAAGGLGSIRGPFLAALVVGVSYTGLKYFAPELGAFFIYALTMAILLRYPRGIFGQT